MLSIDLEIARRFILGLWLEDNLLGKGEASAEALARGFARFVALLGAKRMAAKAIQAPLLHRRVNDLIARS